MSAYIDNTNSVTLSPNTSRLYRCYKVINTMLSKRGYAVNVDNINMTPTAFISKFGQDPDRSSMTIMVEKTDESGKKLMVFFPTDEKVGVKPIKQYTDFMTTSGAQNAIIVLRQGITTFAKQAVAELAATHTIEHFKESELLVDITTHHLVPLHILLTPTEKSDLLARYRLKDAQLPRIQPHDPVARYYGMRRGEVVKIVRPSETAGRYVTYRVCI
mmetsp:Transcript_13367/g.27412  ORF Transcript_13367/g.27412 Transcript_13367/m.27412 type:complete len:216 (+) Transcript_13367:254-901(+)